MGNSIFCSACEPICCEPMDVLTPRHYLADSEKQKLTDEYQEYIASKKGVSHESKDKMEHLDPNVFKWHVKGVQRLNTAESELHRAVTPTSAFIDSDEILNGSFNIEDEGVKNLKLIEC